MGDRRLLATHRAGQQLLALKSNSVCKLKFELKPVNSALLHLVLTHKNCIKCKPEAKSSTAREEQHQAQHTPIPVFPKNLTSAVLTDLFSLKLCQAEQGQPHHWLYSPIHTSRKSRLVSWPLFLDYLTCQWPSKITTISATEVELSFQNSSALQHHKTSSAPRVLDQVKLLQMLLQGQPGILPIHQFDTIYIPEDIQ